MHVLQYAFFLLCAFVTCYSHAQLCTFIVKPPSTSGITTILEPGSLPGIMPGDIICLEAGNYHQILLRNIHGDHDMPVILLNYNGRVEISSMAHYGISVRNCSHIKITGNGEPGIPYGIAVLEVAGGAGISFDQLSTHVRLEYTEIANTLFSGVIAKTDPECGLSSARSRFVFNDLIIANNFIHDTGMEGIYAGSSFYNGYTLNCNGNDTVVLPHLLDGVWIFQNRLERTGRNGIQVNSASGDCRIFDNEIFFDSQAETHHQMGGIQIGGGSSCDCYNNLIYNGKGSGIEVFGHGQMRIFNNLIINAGRSFRPDVPHFQNPKHGIFIRSTDSGQSTDLLIANNTIVDPKSDGILFVNQQAHGSQAHNNMIVNPGSYAQIQSASFINHPNVMLIKSHNLFLNHFSQADFVDAEDLNFRLNWHSAAVDKGMDLRHRGIDFDFDYATRPMGIAFDIGAFEADTSDVPGEVPDLRVFPNPFTNFLVVSINLPEPTDVTIVMYTSCSQQIKSIAHSNIYGGDHEFSLDTSSLVQGIYFLKVYSRHKSPVVKVLRL